MKNNEQKSLPMVSVITPIYNGAAYICECIQSVARSVSCASIAIEHLIIDDGSTDQSVALIQQCFLNPLIPQSYRGRLIKIPHSGKPSLARNRGIELAQGKFIFCLDCDDILLQNSLRHLANYLTQNHKQVVYGDFLRSDDKLIYDMGNDYYGWPHASAQEALYSIFKGEHFYQHSLMFTKSLWQKVQGYDELITYGEDLDLCTRFILASHLPEHQPITTHIHRNHGKNLTSCYEHRSVWLAEKRAHYRKYQEILPFHLSLEMIEKIKNALQITDLTELNDPLCQNQVQAMLLETMV